MTVNPSPTGTNGQYSAQAVQSALAAVPGLVAAEVSKGNVPAAMAADTAQLLQSQLAQLLPAQGVQRANALFRTNLPAALAGAARRAAARTTPGQPPPGSTGADPLGLGAGAGWPYVPPGGAGGAGWAGPGSDQAAWPAARAGAGGNGLSADPGLRPSFAGPQAAGSFFDPTQNPAAGPPSVPAAYQGLVASGTTGSAAGSPSAAAARASGGGAAAELSPGELAAYFNPGPRQPSDGTFLVSEWIGPGQNPFLMRPQLARARRLYFGAVYPCARYYKQIVYGDPDYPARVAQILFGIVSAAEVAALGGGRTSRHILGEAVNFAIAGVPAAVVCRDIELGRIGVEVGTYADTSGVFASLPYSVNGMEIRMMRLAASAQLPGAVSYRFGAGT